MSRIVFEIALSKGKWNYHPSSQRVRRKLERIFEDSLLEVTFDDSGDGAIEAEVHVQGSEDSWESICDSVFTAFLEWKPEYESMIEVGIAYIDEPFDGLVGCVQDDMDDCDFKDRIERIWL